jgi:hypothetical protein
MHSSRHARGLARVVACLFAAVFAFALVLSSTMSVFAAGAVYGNLAGQVIDETSHAPIAGADIVAVSPSGTYHATTNASGHFTILGMAIDSYTVHVTAADHQPASIAGIVLFGDQTREMGTIALLATGLKVIYHAHAISVSSAFQPTQTTDTYTINQQQITNASGKQVSVNENQVLLSVPGVTLTNGANGMVNGNAMGISTITIRGGAAAEVGYQFDGVPFKEPFLGSNGSIGLLTGAGSIQVVEGAGDATQGEVGAGVINVVPQRGTGPGSGLIDAEIGGPMFNHQFGAQYGFATPDNRVSEYVEYVGQNYNPYFGYRTTPLNQYGNYFGTQYLIGDQFLNNFFYKFGHDLNQQFQVLYYNVSQQGYEGVTGPGGLCTSPSCPQLAYYPYDQLMDSQFMLPLTGYTQTQFQSLVGLTPGTPATNLAITQPQQGFSNNTELLKLEWDYSVSPTTYIDLRYYNWDEKGATDGSYSLGPWQAGTPGNLPGWSEVGGKTVGGNLDILHQFGSNLTVTLNGQYNVLYPEFYDYSPELELLAPFISSLGVGNGTGTCTIGGVTSPCATATGADWLPGGYLCGNNSTATDYFNCAAAGTVADTRVPSWGIDYHGMTADDWGTGIRFQYSASDRLRFDVGVRDEGQNRHWISQIEQLGLAAPPTGCTVFVSPCPAGDSIAITNPFDVPSAEWALTEPNVIQPRGSVSFQLNNYNAIRFAYGRSAVFADAQTMGTPFALQGLQHYAHIPAQPNSWCGWAYTPFNTTSVWPCRSYAEELYWQGDNVEAPDAENLPPAVYTNYDASYDHFFTNGWGMKLTGFLKLGTSLPTYYELNPVLGIFAISNQGYNKTTGAELDVTTPQTAYGFSGFFAATYQNVLSTTPPFTTGETAIPTLTLATLELGDLYRAGYVSPFSIRIGGIENFHDGISISPQIQYNIGYPYSFGNLIAGCVAFNPNGTCAAYANVPQVDFGPGITPGISSFVGSAPGTSVSTNYYDPAYAGTSYNPNVDASRGTPGTPVNGGVLSHWNLQANLTVQYKFSGNIIGVQMMNLFGNAWVNSVPAENPWYQPVANGVSGPQTDFNSCGNHQGGPGYYLRGCYPYINKDSYAFPNGAYLLSNGNFTGVPEFGPLVPFSINVYYQRAI